MHAVSAHAYEERIKGLVDEFASIMQVEMHDAPDRTQIRAARGIESHEFPWIAKKKASNIKRKDYLKTVRFP